MLLKATLLVIICEASHKRYIYSGIYIYVFVTGPGKTGPICTKYTSSYYMARISCCVCAIQNLLVLLIPHEILHIC